MNRPAFDPTRAAERERLAAALFGTPAPERYQAHAASKPATTVTDRDRRTLLAARIFEPAGDSAEQIADHYQIDSPTLRNIIAAQDTPEGRLDAARAFREALDRKADAQAQAQRHAAHAAQAQSPESDPRPTDREALAEQTFSTPWTANHAQAANPNLFLPTTL